VLLAVLTTMMFRGVADADDPARARFVGRDPGAAGAEDAPRGVREAELVDEGVGSPELDNARSMINADARTVLMGPMIVDVARRGLVRCESDSRGGRARRDVARGHCVGTNVEGLG
jgi:hypothetical protein